MPKSSNFEANTLKKTKRLTPSFSIKKGLKQHFYCIKPLLLTCVEKTKSIKTPILAMVVKIKLIQLLLF